MMFKLLLMKLSDPTVALVYTMILKLITHVLMLNIMFVWMDVKVPAVKTIFFGLCGMVMEILPIIITNIIIPVPLEARLWVYRLFVYTNPIYGLLYYFIFRRGFKFSHTRSVIIVHYQILISYTITTFFMFLNDFFCRVLKIQTESDKFIPPDYLSFFIIIGVWFAVWYGIKVSLRKNRRHLIIPPNYADEKNSKNVVKISILACLIYLAMVFFRINWISAISNPLTISTGIIYFLLISGLLCYLLGSISQLQSNLLEWEMQATGTYISSLLHTNQEFRAMKHDFYNILQGCGGYLSIKDYEGLQRYYNKLFATTKQAGEFLNLIEVLRSRIAVYSLIETMSKKANKAGVTFSINLVCDVTDVVLDDIDLCRVLGIVLDNAIEGAKLSKDKQINISFERKDESTVVLVISNTTKDDVQIDVILKEGYTTKVNHSGIGLPQLLHILNTYEHCSHQVSYHDYQFTIFLILNAGKNYICL